MSDKYILRSGAIDAIKRNSGTLYTKEAEFLFRKVCSILKNAPAADVASVVRCKDCAHYGHILRDELHACCLYMLPYCRPDDYCSFGLRKGDNGNVSD